MHEVGSSSTPKDRSAITIGAAGVVTLLIVTVVVAVPMIKGAQSGAKAGRQPDVPIGRPSATPSQLSTVTALPHRVEPLRARVLFGVQSVGADIARGIPAAYSAARVRGPKLTSWRKANKTRGALVATASIGGNGNPESKLRAFATLVNDAPRNSIDVAVMAFNYQDVTADTDIVDVFDSYSVTMESVEMANPDITFLYTTVPVTTANSWRAIDQASVTGLGDVGQPVWQDNIARERLNAMIRAQYAPTGRLFDIAALQARIGGGKMAAKKHENQWYYVMNPNLSSNGKQLNKKGSARLADVLMRLVAAATPKN